MNVHNSASPDSSEMISLMGYSLAKESGVKRRYCTLRKAITLSPSHSGHYLNLGRIYLLANKKEPAIRSFKTGLQMQKDPRIVNELLRLGIRKPPVLLSFSRDHLLNILAGKVLKLLKCR